MSSLSRAIGRHFAVFSKRGLSIAEFSLIAALAAIAVIAAMMLLGDLTLG